ncbi:DUF1697 domain-containing protein [Catellatospora coxensis]
MTRYAGLLRGINVGGNKKIAMADLRKLVEGLGHSDVKTLLQSGNVVFSSDSPDQAALAAELERAIEAELGMSVGCLVRDGADLARIIAADPLGEVADNPSRQFVVFLSGAVDQAKLAEVEALAKPGSGSRRGARGAHVAARRRGRDQADPPGLPEAPGRHRRHRPQLEHGHQTRHPPRLTTEPERPLAPRTPLFIDVGLSH